jgi:NAD(P)-dependent dehydrogenase (short-subunit alcohol dehydrogenase family)
VNGLSGKTALVTGGTGVIGGAVALRLAAEGATVAVASRSLERSTAWVTRQAAVSGRLVPCAVELMDPAGLPRALDAVVAAAGTPTVLVCAASTRDALGPDLANFTRLLQIDLVGHYECARLLVERLAGGTASVVFLSSVYAHAGVDPRIYPAGMAGTPAQYVAVKAGVEGLVRYLAAAWGSRGVRVNAVVAGGVRNPQRQNDEFVRRYSAKTMLGRLAEADEIAAAAAFLASDDASYVTGTSLVVDGGLTSW